jgi:hypothetical protein
MGGMLGWDAPHRDIFRKMLCHPKLVPYLRELCGEVNSLFSIHFLSQPAALSAALPMHK